jgi:hypothetical protein
VEQPEPTLDELALLSAVSLSRRYYPQGLDWQRLVRPHLEGLRMSASLLNSFVRLAPTAEGAERYFTEGLLHMPGKPSVALEFGDLVHRFFEDWQNHVVLRQDTRPDALLARYLDEIGWLDFEAAELAQLRQRLQLIYERFMPLAAGVFRPDALAERWASAQLGEVPLTGKFDLLLPDAQAKSYTMFDFKTSKSDGKQKVDAALWRQLRFYKLLLERSPEFSGWTVGGAVDIFVDPTQVEGGHVEIPGPIDMSGVALGDLELLIEAVWRRIMDGDLDVSGFVESRQMAELTAASVYKSGDKRGQPKPPSRAEVEEAFERWLVEG